MVVFICRDRAVSTLPLPGFALLRSPQTEFFCLRTHSSHWSLKRATKREREHGTRDEHDHLHPWPTAYVYCATSHHISSCITGIERSGNRAGIRRLHLREERQTDSEGEFLPSDPKQTEECLIWTSFRKCCARFCDTNRNQLINSQLKFHNNEENPCSIT